MQTGQRISIQTILLALAICAPVNAAPLPEGTFTAADLQTALQGGSIVHRGMTRSGSEATTFAVGYIEALADTEARAGRWCGRNTIKPHEIWAAVSEHLRSRAGDGKNQAANEAVAVALPKIAPCRHQ